MAKEYKRGEKYYLPVTISSIAPGYQYPIELMFADCDERDTTDTVRIADEPNLLLTAEDIAMVINTERDDALEELKSRNAELEALLKEVMATRDEAIRQNDELITENKKLKADCNDWKDTANERLNAVQTLSAERNKVMAGVDELKNTLVDRTKDVQHYQEENDKLRSQVGKYTADIQDMAAEIHFLKADRDKQEAAYDELKGRYDELDSVNKEQAEKIRKLDAERDTWERNAKAWKMTADGMSKRAEELQAENEKLNNRNKYLESEKNRKPIVHVLTNDGHVYAFTSSGKASVKYHTELNILMIEDGEKTIAGFSRGDKPGNLSAWWMG